MRRILMVILVSMLVACAQVPVASLDQEFESYLSEVKAQREKGEIGAVEAQERLRDRYWALFGRDAETVGHFAFSVALMRSAEAGEFPMNEAEALVAAREAADFAMKMESRQVASSYEYPEN